MPVLIMSLAASSTAGAFDIHREPDHVRALYGPSINGTSLLMARRLVEAGVPYITVFWSEEDPVVSKKCASGGGWDTHAAQLVNTDPVNGTHAGLLAQISQAVNAFYNATVELGAANQVTTFTASDFGRTYRSNGDGSDHGWGNHHMIVGGAVKGGDIYGKMPNLTIGGPDDTAQGRWIPTTSVDEYAATLASWFGVSATDLPTVLPNIGRFAKPNLGFV